MGVRARSVYAMSEGCAAIESPAPYSHFWGEKGAGVPACPILDLFATTPWLEGPGEALHTSCHTMDTGMTRWDTRVRGLV